MVFLGAFLTATAALLLAGTPAFRPAGPLLAWVAVGGASWWYIRTTFSQVKSVAEPVGYGMAFGALLGVCAQVAAFGLRTALAGIAFRSMHDVWGIVALAAGVGIAAVVGGLGGLVGALQAPKAARASQVSLVSAAVAAAVALLAGTGIVVYVLTLARAMSDLPS
jgi:hypothetical protein